ncbi:MAG TPA: FemAB family XrtA/PEP-CTERM system-associated protein [Allosphingosinicella sp.]|nr:FemAB family XrtA/PEP-CTERM system-associated protein [Allosphingosinicella sp.]
MFAAIMIELELYCELLNLVAHFAGFSVRQANLDDPSECRRIDSFVADHPEAELFHRPGWTRAVERGTGQAGRYLLAEDPAGRLTGLLPLTRIRSPLFGSALVSTGFGVGGGIVAGTGMAVEALSAAAWSLAEREGCPSVTLRGGRLPEGWRREEGVAAGFLRDLPASEEAILKSIPRKQRAEVRRSLTLGLEVSRGRSAETLDDHYRVYCESVRNLGTPVFPKSLFEAMAREWGEDCDIVLVRSEGRPIAAVLSLYFKGVVHPYWGGGTRAARGLRANDLLYYSLMLHSAERGCTGFDFGRSKVGSGAYSFKKNWGFEPRPLTYATKGANRDLNPRSPRYRLQTAAWRRLPLPIANRLGPLLSRGLG